MVDLLQGCAIAVEGGQTGQGKPALLEHQDLGLLDAYLHSTGRWNTDAMCSAGSAVPWLSG